jgi:lipopolysaccharide/colanic/teichoic acid biosynthesis glycosyltransferase
MKRMMDILGAGFGLVLLSPVIAILWVMIRRRLGAPVLFRQTRPGKDGIPFEMIKFRTMKDALGPDGTPLPDAERLTPFGAKLRGASLDELPELINVVHGLC